MSKHGCNCINYEDGRCTGEGECELQSSLDRMKLYYFSPSGDNHHNAAMCPHCGEPLRKALNTIVKLKKTLENIDEQLMDWEDYTKGDMGDEITLLRKTIGEFINEK